MNNRTFHLTVPLWGIAALLLTLPAAAQQPATGFKAELIQDVEQLEQKYAGLAEAMAGSYSWRPAEGVRSVSEVLMHVANANYMVASIAGVPMPAAFQGANMQETMSRFQAREKLTNPGEVQEAIRQSFAHAKQAIAAVPDDQMNETVSMFGQTATKRRVLTLLVNHMHEHLGQSIAYARTNGVTPPWSGE